MREKLKKRRKEKGFTQETFAEKLNTSVKTIRHIEQGRRFPRESLLKKIIKALETTDLSIFENIEKKTRGDVSRAICKYMNDFAKDNKQYSLDIIKVIRASILKELDDRKNNKLQIRSNSNEGKKLIYKRIALIAKEKFNTSITSDDVCLYKKCTRTEYTDRTGKTTWGIPKERKRQGCSPKTGKVVDV